MARIYIKCCKLYGTPIGSALRPMSQWLDGALHLSKDGVLVDEIQLQRMDGVTRSVRKLDGGSPVAAAIPFFSTGTAALNFSRESNTGLMAEAAGAVTKGYVAQRRSPTDRDFDARSSQDDSYCGDGGDGGGGAMASSADGQEDQEGHGTRAVGSSVGSLRGDPGVGMSPPPGGHAQRLQLQPQAQLPERDRNQGKQQPTSGGQDAPRFPLPSPPSPGERVSDCLEDENAALIVGPGKRSSARAAVPGTATNSYAGTAPRHASTTQIAGEAATSSSGRLAKARLPSLQALRRNEKVHRSYDSLYTGPVSEAVEVHRMPRAYASEFAGSSGLRALQPALNGDAGAMEAERDAVEAGGGGSNGGSENSSGGGGDDAHGAGEREAQQDTDESGSSRLLHPRVRWGISYSTSSLPTLRDDANTELSMLEGASDLNIDDLQAHVRIMGELQREVVVPNGHSRGPGVGLSRPRAASDGPNRHRQHGSSGSVNASRAGNWVDAGGPGPADSDDVSIELKQLPEGCLHGVSAHQSEI